MDVPNINLTATQQQQLLDAGNAVIALQTHLDRLQRAGVDVTSLRAQLTKAEQLRQGLLREFGTGG